MGWQQEFSDLNSSIIAEFGQPITYWRVTSRDFTSFSPITINGDVDTSGEYASPTGNLFGQALVRLADIPLGPQKGDLLIPTLTGDATLAGRTYRVEEIFKDSIEGSATLKMRWIGA